MGPSALDGITTSALLPSVSPRKKGAKIIKASSPNDVPILNAPDRKVCLWDTGDGATCGKTFTKFDSLKRHMSEAHKGT